MSKKHKFSVEVEEITWREIGALAAREDVPRIVVASRVLDDYIEKIINKDKK